MFIAICDDDILYMNKVKEMIEQWGKDNNEDVSVYLFNHGDALFNRGIMISKKITSILLF